MGYKSKAFHFFSKSLLILFSLTILTGCLGSAGGALGGASIDGRTPSSPSPSSIPGQITTTLPPAVVGNILVASNDEAPIIRDDLNQPIRLDKESEEAPIHFEGQNEE